MQVIGRLVARGDVAGLYLPLGRGTQLDGIYNIVEIMGELQIQRVGDPGMSRGRFTGLNISDLMVERPYSVMTSEEIAAVRMARVGDTV